MELEFDCVDILLASQRFEKCALFISKHSLVVLTASEQQSIKLINLYLSARPEIPLRVC